MADISSDVILTIGATLSYAFEATAGTRPTTGYTKIPGIVSSPDFDVAYEKIETTTFDNKNNKTYRLGLKDLGDLEFKVNLSQPLFDLYYAASTGIMDQYETAKEAGKAMWICFNPEGLNKSIYVPVEPQGPSIPAGSLQSVFQPTLRFTASGDAIFGDDPTVA